MEAELLHEEERMEGRALRNSEVIFASFGREKS
jgi:hypothetical protein